MLAKDRNQPKLKALAKAEELTKNIISISLDEKKVPKRKRQYICNRMIDNVMSGYENLRFANFIRPENDIERKERIRYGIEAQKNIMDVCTDLRMLPYISESCKDRPNWYNNIVKESTECFTLVSRWSKSDVKRYSNMKSKEKK